MTQQLFNLFGAYATDSIAAMMQKDTHDVQFLLEELSVKRFQIGHLGIDSNTFVYWKKLELIPHPKDDRGWNRFSFFECVWLKTIMEFRSLGIGLDKVKEIKKALWSNSIEDLLKILHGSAKSHPFVEDFVDKIKSEYEIAEKADEELKALQISLFSLMVVASIIRGEGMAIAVDNRKRISLFSLSLPKTEAMHLLQSDLFAQAFVMVNLYPLIRNLCLLEQITLPSQVASFIVSPIEQELIRVIRLGTYKEIVVKIDDSGKLTHMQLNKGRITPEILSKLEPYLKKGSYKDIQFKVRDGKLIKFEEASIKKF